MTVLSVPNPAYRCRNFESEIRASGRPVTTGTVELSQRFFTKIKMKEEAPQLKVHLTTVFYCLSTRIGAVILTGTEEESAFPRWEKVFEGTAASINVEDQL